MRIVVAGAGPAGLYCAYRIKKRRPEIEIAIFEQNPRDATFGFGVVFSDRALEFLGADDPETLLAIVPHLELWNDITVVHRAESSGTSFVFTDYLAKVSAEWKEKVGADKAPK